MQVTKILGFLCTIISFSLANIHGHHWGRRHQEVALRARGDVDVHKRDSITNARFTFYDVGLGACGKYSTASDYIVALNVDQYGGGYPGPQCFLSITISYGGKTAQAVIMDECMGCPYGGLDFSRGLFDYFASESEGVIYGSWWYSNGGDQTTTSSTWTPPSTPSTSTSTVWTPPPDTSTSWTTSSTSWTPTSTWTPSSTSPPYTPTVASTSSTSTTSSTPSQKSTATTTSSTSTSTNYNTGVASGTAIPSGTVPAIAPNSSPQNLLAINLCIVELGSLIVSLQQVS